MPPVCELMESSQPFDVSHDPLFWDDWCIHFFVLISFILYYNFVLWDILYLRDYIRVYIYKIQNQLLKILFNMY